MEMRSIIRLKSAAIVQDALRARLAGTVPHREHSAVMLAHAGIQKGTGRALPTDGRHRISARFSCIFERVGDAPD